ncbi:uncharacterized protein EAE98_012234 [Botrytis deweyae]|uniref:Peptidase A1 domain-containing protein n=1 Tax=Botrytis deweyae TaxID=2478750 RepID=A0ABQ7I3S5_9HELO|nr:uncharacterized protein EAE98_012234 [Botrytis deweyae]KAF7910091.1 hypothetical protein EAE98_012234 [Botrytis deweyae]
MISVMGICALSQSLLLLILVKYVTGVDAATALSLTPSTEWYGDDGSWSAVSIRLGTPKQWVNLFPNTLSAETWAIGPYGCQDGDSICLDSRGSIFNATQSSTWEPLLTLESSPYWRLGTGNSLQSAPYGEYGLDNLAFGPDGPIIPNATIAMINATEYWVGSFGLGASTGNFSYVTPNVTYAQLETLGEILGAGYGYTAGAIYQQKGEPMSLTLGGYDENRFIPHNVSFTLTQDSPVPQVFVDSISVISSNGSNAPIQLASYEENINALIDSSTPYLWLPETVCNRFAEALGLSYNESLNLYTFDENPTQHNNLSDSSTSTTFTFRFKDKPSASDFVEIHLPYAAFDLSLSYPYIPNTKYGTDEASKFYFPLARSANSSQYTIGRAFLQEAYIITSYETNQFSLYQAVHVSDTLNNKSIVAIPSGDITTGQETGTVSSSQNARLTEGQIAGIVIGVIGTIATLLATLYFSYIKYYKPKKLALALKNSTSESEAGINLQQLDSPPPTGTYPSEAPGDTSHPIEINSEIAQPTEVSAEVPHQRLELVAVIPKELSAETEVELPAEVPANFFRGGITVDNTPTGSHTVSPISASHSGSLPSMNALAISSAEPSFEKGSILVSPTRSSIAADQASPTSSEIRLRPEGFSPVAAIQHRMSPPPTYALAKPNNYDFAGVFLSGDQPLSQFASSTSSGAPGPSNYVFAGAMPSGIQPPNPFAPTTMSRDAQVNEWHRRDVERQEHEEELHRQTLAREEEIRENQFQARRLAHRQELERMERLGTDVFKYRNEDVGSVQTPFRDTAQRDENEARNIPPTIQDEGAIPSVSAQGGAPEVAQVTPLRRFSFENGDDDDVV